MVRAWSLRDVSPYISMGLTYAQFSAAGSREINEDSALCLSFDNKYCFIVADGLGAHGGGDIASQTLIESAEQIFNSTTGDCHSMLKDMLTKSHDAVVEKQTKTAGMLTTAVALAIIDGKMAWAHIGDSRLYWFHKGSFKQRTLDHSVPQMLARSGQISDREIAKHPDRNRVLRAIGDRNGAQFELSRKKRCAAGDSFLLCTDGFWEFLSDEEIADALIESPDAVEWLRILIDIVETHSKGSDMDNYTAITVMV